MATPSPKSVELYRIFAVVCNPTRIFCQEGFIIFLEFPPCGGKSKNRFHPVKSRVKRTFAPRANARICLFAKCPRPPPPRPPATAPEPLRGREVGFCPSSPPVALVPNRRPYPPQSAPRTLQPYLHIPASLLSFQSSSTDEIRRNPPTHPLWVIWGTT